MLRRKSRNLAIALACMAGIAMFPATAHAANADTDTVTLSEQKKENESKYGAYKDKMKDASENWNSLDDKQKKEIYELFEKEMQAKFNLMDKLAEYKVLSKEDVDRMKSRLSKHYDEAKKNNEFPLLRPGKCRKR